MSKKTNWFEERELPEIQNDLDLLKAFSIVKNRFNGNPHCYTRNDYILFINTIYAAFRDLYVSTHLQEDITTDINVGFVDKGTILKKGTSLQEIMEMIFIGNGEEPEPEPPVVEEGLYTNLFNPIGFDYDDINGEGQSDLTEYTPFKSIQYSSNEYKEDKYYKESFYAIIPDQSWVDTDIIIKTKYPIENIISSIDILQNQTKNWPKNSLGELVIQFDWFDCTKEENSYIYKYNREKAKVPNDMDLFIKINFK